MSSHCPFVRKANHYQHSPTMVLLCVLNSYSLYGGGKQDQTVGWGNLTYIAHKVTKGFREVRDMVKILLGGTILKNGVI